MKTTLIAIIVLLLGIGAGYAFFTIQNQNKLIAELKGGKVPPPGCRYQEVQCIKAPCDPVLVCDQAPSEIPVEKDSLPVEEPTVAVTSGVTSAPTSAPAVMTPTSPAVAPAVPVVFEAEGTFTAAEKTALKTRWSEPYLMYQKDQGQTVSSIRFAKYTGGGGYGYTFEAIMMGGGNESSLVMVSGGTPEWWVPGCMVACTFSSAFQTKYPEIVTKANGS